MTDHSPLVRCGDCLFWSTDGGIERLCRRHAPTAGDRQFEVARWSETRVTDACGEGEARHSDDRNKGSNFPDRCDACVYWYRPGIGIDPGNRGDHLRNWWEKAGYCRRRAPRPGGDIGERAFWRATHAADYCFDGRPI